MFRRDVKPTSGNTNTKGAQRWTTQKENNAERRESFVLRQPRFTVNNDMQQRGNELTYGQVECDGFQKVNNCLKMAK
jgi:hypothetical protein